METTEVRPGRYTDREEALLREFGYFCLDKYMPNFEGIPEGTPLTDDQIYQYHSAYAKAQKEISMMGITRFNFNEEDGILTIQLHRPGLLIGSKGDNLEDIQKKLQRENPTLKRINIVEETLNTFLYPCDYSEWEEDYCYEYA